MVGLVRDCVVCGVSLGDVRPNHRYCSPECNRKARSERRRLQRRAKSRRPSAIKCRMCGVEVSVQPVGTIPKFCGESCRRAAHAPERVCKGCGARFRAANARDYCEAACRRRVEPETRVRACLECGVEFPWNGCQVLCGPECRRLRRRARERQYAAEAAAKRRAKPNSDGVNWDAVIGRFAAANGPVAAARFVESLEGLRSARDA